MKFLILGICLLTLNVHAQEANDEIKDLKERIKSLEEISSEQSEIIKRQVKDQYFDQKSRGYLEMKYGRSKLNPEDVEDENNEVFNDQKDSNWENFGHANLLELEIGKTILNSEGMKHEIGVGYQYLRSAEAEASFRPNGGGSKIKVVETITAHTLFGRYALLFKIFDNFYFGPGATLGYSPVSKLSIQLEQGNEGVQVYGEGTSYLTEFFGKAKYEFTRYFFLVATAGYRQQEAENLRLNAAEIVTVKTKTDLDMSGFFSTVGFAVSF